MGSSVSSKNLPHEPYQRRNVISTNPDFKIKIAKNIKVYGEYVECPRGNIIYTKCFYPDTSIISKPKGLVCHCIGYTSCVDYEFNLVAQEYCKKGYVLIMWDHYGHGRSSGLWYTFLYIFIYFYINFTQYIYYT